MEDIKMKEKTRKWKMDGKYYETTDEHYKGLRKEHDHHTYLKEQEEGITIISYESLSSDGELNGETVLASEFNVEELVIKNLMLEKLALAKEDLTGDERLLIDLFYEENKSQDEISDITGIPQTTVSYRLKKVIKKLRKIMGIKNI